MCPNIFRLKEDTTFGRKEELDRELPYAGGAPGKETDRKLAIQILVDGGGQQKGYL